MEPCAHLTHGLAVAPRHGRLLSPCGPSIATAGTSNTGEGIRVVKFTLKTILAVFGLAILFGYLALMVLAPEATPKPDVQHVQPVAPHTKSCKTIPASKWNHLVRTERKIDGSSRNLRNRPVCVHTYKRLKRHVKKTIKKKCSGGNPEQNRCLGKRLAAKRGWTGSQFQCLDTLWGTRESGWSHTAINRGSGAAGIPQRLPMPSRPIPASFYKSPHEQIQWGLNYIAGRYGAPCSALSHSHSVGWY